MKKKVTVQDKAESAMKKAVRNVVAKHMLSGRPISIWEEGKVKRVIVTKTAKRR